MSEDVRECFPFSVLMCAVNSFVFFFLLVDPNHHEGTRSAFRDILVQSVKGV